MSAENFALLGLIVVLLAYSTLIAGAEFHTYSNRELVICEKKERANILKNTAALYFFSYTAMVPIILVIFNFLTIPNTYLPWIIILFLLEHISLEMSRIMIAASKQIQSSVSLFMRSALWCVAVTPLILAGALNSLEIIFTFWGLATFSSILYALWVLRDFADFTESHPVEFGWIKKGIPTAASMLAVAASIQGILTLDRVFLANASDAEFLAAYILYITCATTIVSIVDSGVVVFYTPKILIAAKGSPVSSLNMVMREYAKAVLVLSTLLALIIYVASLYLFQMIGKDEYISNAGVFPVILLALYFYCLSAIPHTKLYALRKEKLIMKAHIFSLIVFAVLTYIGLEIYGVRAVPFSLLLTMSVNLSIKMYMARTPN